MKKITKLLALLLVLTLVFALVACQNGTSKKSDKDDKDDKDDKTSDVTDPPVAAPTIEGKYTTILDIETLMGIAGANEDADEDQIEMVKQLLEGAKGVTMNMELTADNKFSAAMDEQSMKDLVNVMLGNMATVLPAMMGMTDEEFDAALAEQGMTRDDFAAAMAEQLDTEDMFDTSEMNMSGTYRLDGDKLYVTKDGEEEDTNSYWVVEVTEKALIIKEVVGEDGVAPEGAEALLPWTFNRVG